MMRMHQIAAVILCACTMGACATPHASGIAPPEHLSPLEARLAKDPMDRDANLQLGDEAANLARMLPNEHHPYRVKLDAYRRTLPKPKTGPDVTVQ